MPPPAPDARTISVIYVDDEPSLLEIGRLFLEKTGSFTVTTAESAGEAILTLKDQPFDAIISDYQMPGMDGIAFLKHVRSAGDTTPFIIFTGKGREEVVIQALNEGADFYLQKGGDPKSQFAELSNKVIYAVNKRRSEEALQESTRRYSELFDGSRDGFVVVDVHGRFLDANAAYCAMLGYSLDELRSKDDFYTVTPEHWRDWEHDEIWCNRLLKTGASGVYEKEYVRKNGTVFPVELQSFTVRDSQGNLLYLWGVARDITDRKKAEEALLNERKRLERVIEGTRAGTWEWNVQTGETVFNEIWAEIIGYTMDEIKPVDIRTWESFVHPDDLKRSGELLRQHFAGETPYYDCECRMRHKDGHWVWVHDRGRVITYTEDNRPLLMFGTHIEITSRKLAEEALLEQTEELHAAYEQLASSEEELRHNLEELTAKELAIRRQKIELEERYRFEEIVRQNVSRFIKTDNFDQSIQEALADIGTYCRASRSYIFELRDNGAFMDNTYEWCAENVSPEKDNLQDLPTTLFPWWMAHLRNGEMIYTPDISLLPQEASAEREILEPQGVKSIVVLPLTIQNTLIGFIGLDNVQGTAEWSDEAVVLLRIYSDFLGSAFERRQNWRALKDQNLALLEAKEQLAASEEEMRSQLDEIITIRNRLEESNAYLGNLITFANAPIIVWDRGCRITRFNNAFGQLTGITPDEAIGKDLAILFPKETRDASMDLIRRAMAGETWDVVEIPIQHRSGEVRTVIWNSANIRGSDGETIIATIAQGQDITDRKKAELALLQKTEELQLKNEDLAASEEEIRAAYEQLAASEEKLRNNLEELAAQELALRKKTKELADIIEFLPDATFVIDADKNVIAWNRAMEKLTGLCKEEILNRGDYAYSVPFYLEKRPILVDLVLGDNGDTSSRYPYIERDDDRLISEAFIPHLNEGRGAHIWFTASPLYDDDGQIIGAIESIRDITERKRSESEVADAQRLLEGMLDGIPDIVGLQHPDHTMIRYNKAGYELLGLTPEEVEGRTCYELIGRSIPCENCATALAVASKKQETVVRYTPEFGRYLECTSNPIIDENGEIEMIIERLHDITDRKAAEEALRASEERYRTLFEEAVNPILVVDVDGYYIDANEAACAFLECTRDELFTKKVWDFTPPDQLERQRQEHSPFLGPRTIETDYLIHGTIKTLLLNVVPLEVEGKTILYGIGQDITELKRIQSDIREAKEQYQSLVGNIPGITFRCRYDRDWTMLYMSDAIEPLSGYPASDFIGNAVWTYQSVIHPDDTGSVTQNIQDAVESGLPWDIEYRILHRDGGIRWVHETGRAVLDADGDVQYLDGVILDITERKAAEEALRASKEQLETLSNNLPGSMIYQLIVDPNGNRRFTYVSAGIEDVHGITQAEALRNPKILYDQCLDIDKSKMIEAEKLAFATLNPFSCEWRFRSPEGEIRWSLTQSKLKKLPDGSILCDGIQLDITDRKRTEEALRENEERSKAILNTLPDLMFIFSRDGRYLDYHASDKSLLTIEPEYFIGKSVLEIIPEEIAELFLQSFARVYSTNKLQIIDYSLDVLGGSKHFEARITAMDEQRLIALIRDITERKNIGDKYRAIASMLDIAPSSITIHDYKGNFFFANQKTYKIHGYSKEEFLSKNLTDIDVPSSAALIEERMQQIALNGEASFEVAHWRKDGSIVPLEVFVKQVEWDGTPALLSIATDITERRESEHHLAAAQKRLKEAHQLANIGIWDWVMETDSMTWSEELYAIAGRDPALPALNYRDHQPLYTPASWERLEPAIHTTLKTGKSFNLELEMVRPDGTIRHVHALGHQSHDMNGNLIGLHGTVQDITDRKIAEEALHTANKKLQLLSSITRHDIMNKIMALQAYLDLIRAEINDPELSGYLTEAEKAAGAIQKQIEFTGVYESLGMKEPAWQPFTAVIGTIHDARLPIRHDCEDVSIYADPMFEKVLHNLYDNTIRHAEGADSIQIRCEEEEDGSFVITWEDNGVGIPDDQKEQIFNKGVGKHTGFGLFLSREILSITGITIAETGVYGEGARFEICVPGGAWQRGGVGTG